MSVIATRLYLVRHAPVKAMMPGRIYGQRDVGCNLKDTDRLRELADQLNIDDAIWVSSSLSRTKKTAHAIAEQGGFKVRPLAYKELMEQNFGLWQSKTWDELEDDPDAKAFWDNPATNTPPDGESFETLCKRVQKTIAHLLAKYQGKDIIIIAHAGTIRAIIAYVLDIPTAQALNFKIDTLSLSSFTHFTDPEKSDSWSINAINA